MINIISDFKIYLKTQEQDDERLNFSADYFVRESSQVS